MEEPKDPPRGGSVPTRRILRKEANFGCAICGEPYLTYHHFDPPWKELHHDNPEGMIALCVKHAALADANTFTKEQLRARKRSPANKSTMLESTFEWFRQNFLFIVGGNVTFKCNTILESSRERIIWLEEDEATASRSISMNIRDQAGSLILSMDKNQWTSDLSLVEDVDSSARGHKLKVTASSKNASFEVAFRSVGISELEGSLIKLLIPDDSPHAQTSKKLVASISSDMAKEFEEEVPLCIVTGTFYLPQKIILGANKMIYGGVTIGCSYSGASPTAFHFG
ncbi:MAG TPA: HNH endonuclease signature motif containing protein [Candidatus Saccharimonadales bacterium]|nr:HNH endonuclease signature motif containing protein [Candidatus Saccharimonadales bacterium]